MRARATPRARTHWLAHTQVASGLPLKAVLGYPWQHTAHVRLLLQAGPDGQRAFRPLGGGGSVCGLLKSPHSDRTLGPQPVPIFPSAYAGPHH